MAVRCAVLDARCSTAGTRPWAPPLGAADPHKIPIDPNGNLTSKTEGADIWTYEWNARNELTRVTKNGVEQARFSYDPLGRRAEKVTDGVTTSYTYDRMSMLREVRGATAFGYVNGFGADEPMATDDGTGLSYIHADGLGSVVKRTSGAGAVTLTREYDAWGNLQAAAGESGHSFTGREWDPEIRLYYYRARYYDATAGRFVSEDPIGFRGGQNFFAYVINNPVNRIDPTGLESCCQACPGGTWSGWGGNIGGSLGGGVYTGVYRVCCWSSNVCCTIMTQFVGLGPFGLGGSLTAESIWIRNARTSCELGGCTGGMMGGGGAGVAGAGGSFGTGEPVVPSGNCPTSGSSSSTFGAGVGLGGALHSGTTMTTVLSCSRK